jgi:hypothetical protein
MPALRPGIAHIFADVAKSAASVVGRDAFLDMVDMSADAEPCPLLGRQRNWPRGSLWYGRHTMRRWIEAIIRRLSQGRRGRVVWGNHSTDQCDEWIFSPFCVAKKIFSATQRAPW